MKDRIDKRHGNQIKIITTVIATMKRNSGVLTHIVTPVATMMISFTTGVGLSDFPSDTPIGAGLEVMAIHTHTMAIILIMVIIHIITMVGTTHIIMVGTTPIIMVTTIMGITKAIIVVIITTIITGIIIMDIEVPGIQIHTTIQVDQLIIPQHAHIMQVHHGAIIM
jgi:hypothetical protein